MDTPDFDEAAPESLQRKLEMGLKWAEAAQTSERRAIAAELRRKAAVFRRVGMLEGSAVLLGAAKAVERRGK